MKTLSLSPSPRIASAPAPARPHPVQEQEATTAASRLSHDFTSLPVQTKLAVNTPGDEYEREADDVAERVMRMPAAPPNIQRKCAECEEEEESSVQASQSSGELEKDEEEPAAAAQGAEGFSQEEEFVADQAHIFRKASVNAPPAFATASSSPAPVAASLREGGLPLPSAARRHMEAAFGRDFSQVRVHHDSAAADTSRQLSALAFTHRNHIHFASGMFNPGASSGKRLLAHELTHVVQQGYSGRRASLRPTTPSVVAQAPPSLVQRVFTNAAGTVNQNRSLADTVLNGAPVGVTNATLNGTVLNSGADTRAAIAAPVLVFSSAASGNVIARVGTVPTNTGSFIENVLSAGPWTSTVPKTAVGAALPGLVACTGAGNCNFRARGVPNDGAMATANRRHENHHVADFKAAFDATLKPWDTRLTAAATAGTAFNGATEAAAQAALFTAMGGTTAQTADAFTAAAAAAIGAFHATAAGGVVVTDDAHATADATCSTASVGSTNPG